MRLEVDRLDKVGDAFRSRSGYIHSRVNKYGSDLTVQHHRKYEGGHIVGHQFGGPPEEINCAATQTEWSNLTWLIVGWLGCLGAGCCWDCGGCVGWGAH